MAHRTYRAGDRVEDRCRACHIDRFHTVIVADARGRPSRVQCDFCGSQHNYRGGVTGSRDEQRSSVRSSAVAQDASAAAPGELPTPKPLVSRQQDAEEDRNVEPTDRADLERLIRRVIREETGLTPVAPAQKWRGGALVLRPGNPALQEKTWPIDAFFHKIVMIRNRLRTLEQQVNASALPADEKIKLQGYISGCYGTLTSFNVLFADAGDQFKGAGGED